MGVGRLAEKLVALPMALVLAFGMLPAAAFGALAAALPQRAHAAASSGTWHGVSYDIDSAGNVTFHAGEMTGNFRSDDPFKDADGLKDATSVRADGLVLLPNDSSGLFYRCSKLRSVDFSNFDALDTTNMASLLSGCSSLASLSWGGIDTSQVTVMSHLLYGCSSLPSVDLSGLDTSLTTNMSGMFQGCSSLSSLQVGSLDTSKVKEMSWMFAECSALTSLDVSALQTSQVTTVRGMFSGCSGLKSLQLGSIVTSRVQYFNSMFSDCAALPSLDLSSLDTSNATDMSGMFDGCGKLKSITLGAGFSFKGAGSKRLGSLPTGIWASSADGKRYRDEDVPDGVAATYTLFADAKATNVIDGKVESFKTEVSGQKVVMDVEMASSAKKSVKMGKKEILVSLRKVRLSSSLGSLSLRFGAKKSKKKKSKKSKTFVIPKSKKWSGWKYTFVEIGTNAFSKVKSFQKTIIPVRVEKIDRFAFKGSGIKTVILRTTRLTKTKRVKLCLKKSKVKTVQSPKSVYKKYKKVFVKKAVGKNVRVTR